MIKQNFEILSSYLLVCEDKTIRNLNSFDSMRTFQAGAFNYSFHF